MKASDKIKLAPEHTIEWGPSTKDGISKSIRNRYDDPATGKFNRLGSAELFWEDFNLMILESIRRNHFSKTELRAIIGEILIP